MRRTHLEAFAPVCPLCRTRDGASHRLAPGVMAREESGDVIEGSLVCTHKACSCEFPILDGIPFLLADVRRFVQDNLAGILAREDLTDHAESMIADCAEPASAHAVARRYLSIYARDHYGEFDPAETPDEQAPPGAACRLLHTGLALLNGGVRGHGLDVGCATGRGAFELAARTDGLVLGVDANIGMLRVARRVLREGRAVYPRRRVGLVHERRAFDVPVRARERVDFWAADAASLPFAAGVFGVVSALNVLDATPSPVGVLREIVRVSAPGAGVVLSSPYDWEGSVTPVEAWIGGHSQRATNAGRSEPLLRALLTTGAHPQSPAGVRIVGEVERAPWRLRLHDRSVASYEAHVIAARVDGPTVRA